MLRNNTVSARWTNYLRVARIPSGVARIGLIPNKQLPGQIPGGRLPSNVSIQSDPAVSTPLLSSTLPPDHSR
ncbi:MAG: hypothetical protein QOJ99_2817 [Bryobacterales bacterium]|nr:hypothetical protein [Bryobacterales bacterium]